MTKTLCAFSKHWLSSARRSREFAQKTLRQPIRSIDFYRLGVAPSRIDILTSINGVLFEDAWTGREEADFGDVRVQFISLEDLLSNKRTTGRLVDMADCERLEEAKNLLS